MHCIPTRLNHDSSENKPRPIVTKLTFFKDKGRIFKHVKNINKDLKIGVADDYPKEVEQMRKALLPVLKKAKQEKKQASFSVDKLIIDGQVYRGPETKKLPYYGKIMTS